MDHPYDPLRASYRYVRREDPGDRDRLGGTYGDLLIDETLVYSTWWIDGDEASFEADPCSCGSPLCGLHDIHARRSGPYVSWTAWVRRTGEPAELAGLPLLFSAEAYARTLGGSVQSLPPADGAHSLRLLGPDRASELGSPESVWWWEEEALDVDPGALVRFLLGASAQDLATSRLVPLADPPRRACSSEEREVLAALVDGEFVVRMGALLRFPVGLLIPGLRAALSARAP